MNRIVWLLLGWLPSSTYGDGLGRLSHAFTLASNNERRDRHGGRIFSGRAGVPASSRADRVTTRVEVRQVATVKTRQVAIWVTIAVAVVVIVALAVMFAGGGDGSGGGGY
jgi:hypothetical protein